MRDIILEIDRDRAVELIEKYARYIVERRMGPAAILAIESLRPLNFIGSQVLHAVSPFAEVFFDPKEYQEMAALLESREYVQLLIKRIDELDDELHSDERKKKSLIAKRRRKKRKDKITGLKNRIFKKKIKSNQGEE